MVEECRCAASLCDLDLTFDLDVVTLIFKGVGNCYLVVTFGWTLKVCIVIV